MATYLVQRDGETKLRVPNGSIKSDGTLRGPGGEIVVNAACAERLGVMAEVKALVQAKRWGTIIERWPEVAARIGTHDGLTVIDESTYLAERRAAAEARMTPGQIAWRDQILPLEERVERLERSDYYDAGAICRARIDLQSAIARWRAEHPQDAAAHDAESLRGQADHKRSLAVGALTYDADGWLSAAEQQRRHDELVAEAEDLGVAGSLTGGNPCTPLRPTTFGGRPRASRIEVAHCASR